MGNTCNNEKIEDVCFGVKVFQFCVFVMHCADIVAMPSYNRGNNTYICHLD